MADKLKLIDQYAIRLLESDPNAYSEEWNADYERGFLDAINKALEIPTIEAEPVKHGRWEYDHTICGMKHYHCTNCKNSGNECIADENEILWWEFCPRCSARMDLKDGDSDAI